MLPAFRLYPGAPLTRGAWRLAGSQPPVDQNFTLNATWMFRSVVPQSAQDGLASIAVIWPKAALPNVAVRLRELRVVQQVERLDAELGVDAADPRRP